MAASDSSPSSPSSPTPAVKPSPLAKPAAVVEGAADGLADGLDRERPEEPVRDTLHRVGGSYGSPEAPRSQRLRARLDQVGEKVDEVVDKTRVRARAVAETARRAREAPPTLMEEITGALRSWSSGLAKGLGLTVAAGLVAAIALTVFTVALVQGLNQVWGTPGGTFAVAALYAIVAIVLFSSGKGKAEEGRLEAKAQLVAAREEMRHVTRPVRRAFRGDDDLAARSGAIDSVDSADLVDVPYEEPYMGQASPGFEWQDERPRP